MSFGSWLEGAAHDVAGTILSVADNPVVQTGALAFGPEGAAAVASYNQYSGTLHEGVDALDTSSAPGPPASAVADAHQAGLNLGQSVGGFFGGGPTNVRPLTRPLSASETGKGKSGGGGAIVGIGLGLGLLALGAMKMKRR